MSQSLRLVDQSRAVARMAQLSLRTEASDLADIKAGFLFHHKQHPRALGVPESRAYLSPLAVERHVAAATQNVALCALLLLYRRVLKIDLPNIDAIERARRPARLPVVFTRVEVKAILAHLDGVFHRLVNLLYGTGRRSIACLRLRVKEIDFEYRQMMIRDGKGQVDRRTMLPALTLEPLQQQLVYARHIHQVDLKAGDGAVSLLLRLAVNGLLRSFGEKGRERSGTSDESWVSGCANTCFTKSEYEPEIVVDADLLQS